MEQGNINGQSGNEQGNIDVYRTLAAGEAKWSDM